MDTTLCKMNLQSKTKGEIVMSGVNLFMTVVWCFLKPLLFLIIPTIIIGEKYFVNRAID